MTKNLNKQDLMRSLQSGNYYIGNACRNLGITYPTFKTHADGLGFDYKKFIRNGKAIEKETMKNKKFTMSDLSQSIIDKIKTEDLLVDVPYEQPFEGKQEEVAHLMLSDMHVGKKNSFLNYETGETEETYNTNTCISEANTLVKGIHEIIRLLSPTYNIDTINIFSLGDLIDNDFIYKGQQFYVDIHSGDQLWTGFKIISDILNSMKKVFKNINYISVPGNHGRVTPRYEASPSSRSWDYHLGKILDVAFKDDPRVNFTIPDSWFTVHKTYDWKYFLHHGNSVFSWMSMPYYGITRQSKARKVEMNYDIECIGHFHQRMTIPIGGSNYVLVNGAWIPKDEFAWQKFGVISKPEQTFFGASRKRPRTWSFGIDLEKDMEEIKNE